MIYVSEEQLSQVEYLLNQSYLGNHVLFSNIMIRTVFSKRPVRENQISEADAYELEHHLEKLIELPTLPHKRHYLEKLNETTRDKLVLTYFNIIDNSLFESSETRH